MNYSEILKQMSLEEKIALCSGKDFWHSKGFEKYGIPSVMMCDGPHGLRKQENEADMLGMNESVPATAFPTAALTGCSWDTELLGQIGEAIAQEAAANQVGVFLGPGCNIKRNPLCGRNFEYFSEDPYLAGTLAGTYIARAQEKGIGTSLKHFACNSQEYKRFSSDSVVDQRALREIYLSGFELAVKQGHPATVMCAYNKLNGIHCSDNAELLTHILREEWGFEGMVVTDWGAMHDRIEGFKAGCDLSMPGGSGYMEKAVLRAVRNGELPEAAVDACADRVLTFAFRAKEALSGKHAYDREAHHDLARRAAEQSAVLLKNENGILPIRKGAKVVLIGMMAENPRYQGAGSSHIKPTRLESLRSVMPEAAYALGCLENGETNEALLSEAKAAAKSAEVCVVCVGLTDAYESEGFDRQSMAMPEGHLKLIEAVSSVSDHVVVLLYCGSVVETPWLDGVQGLLYMGLPGQAGGQAARNLLYGEANPSGRLAETWPLKYEDCPSADYYGRGTLHGKEALHGKEVFHGKTKDALYKESIYVGYRYYDKARKDVRFRFGEGLSYTSFSYDKLIVEGDTVRLTVTNTGSRAGSEVVQLYVALPGDGIHRPLKELKRYRKIYLEAGESRQVEFTLDSRCFAVWDASWRVPSGSYGILVGGRPNELLSAGTVKIGDAGMPAGFQGKTGECPAWYQTLQGEPSKEEWEQLLGRSYVEVPPIKGQYTMDNTVMEMKEHSLIMKIMYKAVEATVAKGFGGKADYAKPEFRMMMSSSADCSLSGMQINGGMKDGILQGLLEMANGHFIKGIFRMIKGT
ncbi:MAG: glycoside hydrolase family 3 C-terminal domain-containing protein [Roseburia sp.]|nr:glycoside hydrolase family 3 C-terminal domain-containing protein [Roseburia sp.]MCM1099408.1 glycoside hydrolase family 3 C-terminal domain-containing protein [Ruminococcus flavefaciens]